MKKAILSLFLPAFFSALIGCGEGKAGVALKVTTATPGVAPVSKALLAASGDGDTDFPDRFITPSSFTIGFKSFKMFREGETTPSYTLFEEDPTAPRRFSLTSAQVQEVKDNVTDPRAGTYDRIEYEIGYYEMIIPLCGLRSTSGRDCHNRRLRYYLADMTDSTLNNALVTASDILLSQSENGLDLGWIRRPIGLSDGGLTLAGLALRPNDAHQVPPDQFPLGIPTPIFSLDLSPKLEIPKNPKDKYIFTLSFDLESLFFFDNTDETGVNAVDTSTDFEFNALVDDPAKSRDGKLDNCGLPCPDTEVADFWPGLPDVTVTYVKEPQN
ncbi:MAG TPA: hypothetical protein VIK48_01090 [Candidatus Manganitrophaceae bacterium]